LKDLILGVVGIWLKSKKEFNKLMHMLNGNTMPMEIDYKNVKFEAFADWSQNNENRGTMIA
jgi:hypothetical protein